MVAVGCVSETQPGETDMTDDVGVLKRSAPPADEGRVPTEGLRVQAVC